MLLHNIAVDKQQQNAAQQQWFCQAGSAFLSVLEEKFS